MQNNNADKYAMTCSNKLINQPPYKVSIYPLIANIFFAFLAFIAPFSSFFFLCQIITIIIVFLINITKYPISYLFYIGAIAYAALAVIVNGSNFSFLASFGIVMLTLICVKNMTFSKKELNMLNISFALVLALSLIFYSKKNGLYYENIFDSSKLMNPNFTGMIIYALGGILISIICDNIKKKSMRWIILTITFVSIGLLIYDTAARTSLGAWALFAFLNLCGSKYINIKKKKNQPYENAFKFGLILAISISIMLVIGYVYLSTVLPHDIIILGKPLFTGRQRIWKEALEVYPKNFLFGMGSDYIYCNKYVTPHNGFLALMCYYSIIALIAFIVLTVTSFNKGRGVIDKNKYFVLIGFIFLMTFDYIPVDVTYFYLILPFYINRKERFADDT